MDSRLGMQESMFHRSNMTSSLDRILDMTFWIGDRRTMIGKDCRARFLNCTILLLFVGSNVPPVLLLDFVFWKVQTIIELRLKQVPDHNSYFCYVFCPTVLCFVSAAVSFSFSFVEVFWICNSWWISSNLSPLCSSLVAYSPQSFIKRRSTGRILDGRTSIQSGIT